MLAVIHRSTPPRGAGALPLAGPPLVIRQLQWLRCFGCEAVAIDVGQDDRGEAVWRQVAGHEILARNVVFVRSAVPLSPRTLALEAGFPDARLLAIPESVVGSADLAAFYRGGPGRGARVGCLFPPETGGPFQPAEIRLLAPADGPSSTELLPGWGASLESPGAALRLAGEALLGRLPSLLLHAAEQAPGVWVARGGRIEKGAVVHPPALIGAGARVCRGARIGPGALIGARAIIEPGATVEHALVEDDTVVGEGLEVQETIATPDGLAPLDGDGPMLPLRDPLLLARRRPPLPLAATSRLRIPGWAIIQARFHSDDQEGVRRDSRDRATAGSGSSPMRSSPSRR